jgi:hypothetical protein
MDKTDLEHWRRELEKESTSTVSFALAGRAAPTHTAEFEPHEPEPEPHDRFDVGGPSVVLPPEEAAEVRPPAPSVLEPVDVGIDTEADRESAELPLLVPRSRGRGVAFAVVLVLLMAGTAGAAFWLQSRGDDDDEQAAAHASDAAVAPPAVSAAQVNTRPPPVVVTQLPPAEAKVEPEEPIAMPPESVAPPPAKGKAKRRAPPARKGKVKKPEEKKASGSEAVQARFRAARREYDAFKDKFGARLEAEWNELADRANDAKTPQQLADLDRKIRQFRGRMSSEKWGPKGEPLDPLK